MTACMLFAYTNINPSTMQNKQKKRRKKNPIESLLTRIYFFLYIKNFYLVFHLRSILNYVYSLYMRSCFRFILLLSSNISIKTYNLKPNFLNLVPPPLNGGNFTFNPRKNA